MKFLLVLDPEEVGQLPDSLRQQIVQVLTPNQQHFQPQPQQATAAPQEAQPAAEKQKRGRKPKGDPAAAADLTAVVQNAPTEGPVFGGQMLPTQKLSPETVAAADQMNQQQHFQQQQFAPGTQGLPPAQPTKVPVIQGNAMAFPPSMGHPTQANMGVDVLTGQPIPIQQAPNAPFMPQMQGVPVNPVQPFAPPQQAAPSPPQANANQARQMAVQVMSMPNGQNILQNALSRSGMSTLSQLNDQNAPMLGYYLQAGVQNG